MWCVGISIVWRSDVVGVGMLTESGEVMWWVLVCCLSGEVMWWVLVC